MESYDEAANSSRFVVEDSIAKVTSDGQPHEMMTMIAGLSGLLAAVVILSILATLVGCKRTQSSSDHRNCEQCPRCEGCSRTRISSTATTVTDVDRVSKCSSTSALSTVWEHRSDRQGTPRGPKDQWTSVSIIYDGNMQTNLNEAFVGSELGLRDSLHKQGPFQGHRNSKRIVRSDPESVTATKETAIEVEHF